MSSKKTMPSALKPLDFRRTHSASSTSLTHPSQSYTPITAHYKLNYTLYTIFQQLIHSKDYVTGLAVGVQFARVALWDLPQHGYYNAPKYKQEKKDNARLALNVCHELSDTVIPRVERNVKRFEKRLLQGSSSSSTSSKDSSKGGRAKGKDICEGDLKGIKERIEEARLLLDVAKEHMAEVESAKGTRSTTLMKKTTGITKNSTSKVASSKPSSDPNSGSWVQTNVSRILDCGESVSVSLCPSSNLSLGRVPEEEQVLIEGVSPSRHQLQNKYYGVAAKTNDEHPPPLEFERSSSAPVGISSVSFSKHQEENMNAKPPKKTNTGMALTDTKPPIDKTRRDSNTNSSNKSKHKKKDKKQRKGSSDQTTVKEQSKRLTKVHQETNTAEMSVKRSKIKAGKARTDNVDNDTGKDASKDNEQKKKTKKVKKTEGRKKEQGVISVSSTESSKASQLSTPTLSAPTSSSSSESKGSRKSVSSNLKLKVKAPKAPKHKQTNTTKVNKTHKDNDDDNNVKSVTSSRLPVNAQAVKPDLVINCQQDDSTSTSTASHTSANTSDEDEDMKLNSHISPLPNTKSEDSDLQRALYLSGLEFQTQSSNRVYPSMTSPVIPSTLKRHTSDQLDISTLSELYKQDFEELRRRSTRRIHVTYIETYQGRLRETINGCTVIAPLLAIQLLKGTELALDRNSILSEGMNNKNNIYVNRALPTSLDDAASEEKKDSEDVLSSPLSMEDLMLSASTIQAVIDVQTPMVLPKVREHLGLHRDALIIPSDVHDYLYEHKFLCPGQYVDVFGGNILDDKHLDNFIEALSSNESTKQSVASHVRANSGEKESDVLKVEPTVKKLAATFFFHEHVVCIHRITRKVDSVNLDNVKTGKKVGKKRFLRRIRGNKKVKLSKEEVIEKAITKEETWFEIIDSLPNSQMLCNYDDKKKHRSRGAWLSATARMRCTDVDSLKVCLRWYACSKFSDEDRKFINSYQWDDGNFNFDPRVFQSFLWSV